ncbi:MAG TPA: hypothetical protein VFS21_22775 [Roseiflexaceae bacterium]|nr:hypothetical protein [Roseiflexaceae bacterium]
MLALLAHTSLISLAPIVVAWGLNFPWWVVVLMMFSFIGPTLGWALVGVGVLVWCVESIQEHSELRPTRPIAITALVLGLVAAGLLLRDRLPDMFIESRGRPRAGAVLPMIAVLSWFTVAARARSGASRLHAVIPALVTLGYVGFVLSWLIGVPGFNVLIVVLIVGVPPLISPKLAMLLGILFLAAAGVLELLSWLPAS